MRYLREGERKLSRRVDLPEEHVPQSVAELVSAEEGMQDGRSVLDPGHSQWSTRLSDDDGVGVGGEDRFDERVARAGEGDVVSVEALGLPVRVGADDDDGDCGQSVEISF